MENGKEADFVLKSNAVFTGLTADTFKGGIAIKGNRIVAVGDETEISKWIGARTRVLVFNDELIMPGFNDAHFHLPDSSLLSDENYCVLLFDCKSEEECVNRVAVFAAEHPDYPWIYGAGWNHWLWNGQKLPDRKSLDKLKINQPVCLQSFDMHSAWINSNALEVIGIDYNTPEPEIGAIGKYSNGEPSGLLLDTEAVFMATAPALALSENKLKSVIENFINDSNRYGITTIADVYPRGVAQNNAYDIYQKLDNEGRLSARIMFFHELKNDLSEAKQLREQFASEKVRFCGLKQLADGVVETHTACMVEPYTDKPLLRGELLIPEDVLRSQILNADNEGFNVRVHAIGDGAVRLILDCFEEAEKHNGVNGTRHSVEHIETIQADDIPRFAVLGVTASMQPFHCVLSSNSFSLIVGKERCKRAWALKSIINTGAKYAIGTDSPVADMNPFNNIYAAVTRMNPEGFPEGGFNPGEKITVAEALKGYTAGSAWIEHMDEKIGTLEAGKLADVIVLSKNLLNIPVKDIPGTSVKLTIMDGKIVYCEQ